MAAMPHPTARPLQAGAGISPQAGVLSFTTSAGTLGA
jgi:hypothetical protein